MDVMGVLSYGIGTLVGFALLIGLAYVFISTSRRRSTGCCAMRNYPVVGHLRYFFEEMGEYFRQYFFAGDRDEMPFTAPRAAGSTGWRRTRAG